MKINERGVELEEHFESLHDGDLTIVGLQPKKDPKGIWTVGYGRALRDEHGRFLQGENDKNAAYNAYPALSQEEARSMLAEDNAYFEQQVSNLVKIFINEDQFSALVSFAYNLGAEALRGSTLLKLLNAGDFAGASNQFRRWTKCDGRELRGLIRRRNNEKRLFLSLPFNFEDES